MKYAGARTIYACKEYEEVHIPIEQLIGKDGLKIYPEVSGKGYFDIDYRNGTLSLRATKFIGLIPISENISIHVEPRTPISNLMHMVQTTGLHISGLREFLRGYQIKHGEFTTPEEIYVAAYMSALDMIREKGILKRYIRYNTESDFRGHLLLSETVSRFRSQGISYKTTFERYELTENNPENKILKYTALRLLDYFRHHRTREAQAVAEKLRGLLRPFSLVSIDEVNEAYIAQNVQILIRTLPRVYHFYGASLWLAYLISTRSGISMEKIGQAEFETIILDAATIFENYIRRIIEVGVQTRGRRIKIVDGNKQPVPLFMNKKKFETHPDYYFLRDGSPVAVADAKYKPNISTADRYELLAFCEALSVNMAAFLVPKYLNQDVIIDHGVTRSGKSINQIAINLSATNIELEEQEFLSRLYKCLDI